LSEILICIFIGFGILFILSGSIALLRFPDFYSRTHGPTKTTTLGVSSIVIATLIFFYSKGITYAATETLLIFFLFLTAPAAAHMLTKAALEKKVPRTKESKTFRAR